MVFYLLFLGHVNNKDGTLLFVMLDRVDFCVVVRSIFGAAAPYDIKYALRHLALEPMKPHVHGFRCFWDHCALDKSVRCGVISSDEYLWLSVAHFFKCDA